MSPTSPAPVPLLDPDGIDRLREALQRSEYTPERFNTVNPATAGTGSPGLLQQLSGGDRFGTLVRLFVMGRTEPMSQVAGALDPLPLSQAYAAGLLEHHGDGVRALVNLHPYGDGDAWWWVLSDMSVNVRPGKIRPDHVLGVGNAAMTLAQAAVPVTGATALDIGTGCGVQALHLSRRAQSVTASDTNPRALQFAATTAALNGMGWELVAGDLAAPVAGRRFDLVVSNPPFVVGPPIPARYSYRDSGREGDLLTHELIAAAPKLLNEGGWMQFLANWLHIAGEDPSDRVQSWLSGTGLDAWIIQREAVDPAAYVRQWLRDAGELSDLDTERGIQWLDWFAGKRVDAIGFGIVTLHRSDRADPLVRVEDVPQELERPLGPHVLSWFQRQDWLQRHPRAALLAAHYTTPDSLRLHTEMLRGSEGWDIQRELLTLTSGMRWLHEVEAPVATLIGGCNGSVPMRDQLAILAAAYGAEEDDLAVAFEPMIRFLVERGFILPVDLVGT